MGCGGSSSTQVITPFLWGSTGSVAIKTIKLLLAYDAESKTILTKIPNNRITDSVLSWKGRKFSVQDTSITDLDINKTYNCPDIKASFLVSEYDQFKEMVETEDLFNQIKSHQGVPVNNQQKNILLNNIKKELKDFWDFTKEYWIKYKNTAEKKAVIHLGRDCLSYTVEKIADPLKIKEFLSKKFGTNSFGKIKRNIKAKVIMEKSDFRPHIVKLRKSAMIQMDIAGKTVVDLQEEVRVMIFCWDDIPQIREDSFIENEYSKLQSATKIVYSDIKSNIDSL